MQTRTIVASGLIFFVALAVATPAAAQQRSGNLYGTATDNDGASLPGVTVTVTPVGGGPRQIQISNAQGQFRFLGLPAGSYQLTSSLDGFSTVEYPNITIGIGRNSTLEVEMSAAIEETITVTSESPLLDERKIVNGTSVTQIELEKIPTARDPWSVLQNTPGVQVDRINVGGNESGQQSFFNGSGGGSSENVWAVDGVVITDMAIAGGTPSYYNFDAFEEMQITTGGSDASLATGGVTLNMVTKRGTNEWRGSGRFIIADLDQDFGLRQTAGNQRPDDFGAAPGLGGGSSATEFSGMLGGPLWKDKIWFWAAGGQQSVNGGDSLPTSLGDRTYTNFNAKATAQLMPDNTLTAQWLRFETEADRIGAADSSRNTPETTWNQSGPTDIWKVEDTHVFTSNFYLTGLFAVVRNDFRFDPNGGADTPTGLGLDNVWTDSFLATRGEKNNTQARLDGNYFFNTGAINHEIRFGASFRNHETSDSARWPGDFLNVQGIPVPVQVEIPDPQDPNRTIFEIIDVHRNFLFFPTLNDRAFESSYTSFYVQDTVSTGNWTVNLGFRYDLQEGANNQSTAGPNPLFPDLVPGATFAGGDASFDWETISPRIGVTYALGEERKTLLRASYSRFPEQLGQGLISRTNPVAPGLFRGSAVFDYLDFNGNGVQDANENSLFSGFFGVPSDDPSFLDDPDRVDPGLDPSITEELVLGVEHAFLPEFVAGATFTWRTTTDLPAQFPLVDDQGMIRQTNLLDYVLDGQVTGNLPDGTPFNEPFFAIDPGLDFTGGKLLTNGTVDQDYLGVSLTFNKRLANRWMLRGNLTFQDWDVGVDNEFLVLDDPTETVGNPDVDGDPFIQQSPADGRRNIFLNSGWSFNTAGMYQVAPDRPWGFNVAANIHGRQGYPLPYFVSAEGSDDITRKVQVSGTDEFRNDDIFTVDLRLEKEFALNDFDATLSVDAFNIFDENYVLQREANLADSRGGFVDEILSPRVFRVGIRLNWR